VSSSFEVFTAEDGEGVAAVSFRDDFDAYGFEFDRGAHHHHHPAEKRPPPRGVLRRSRWWCLIALRVVVVVII